MRSIFILCAFTLAWHATATNAGPVSLPDGNKIDKVDFERHVQALLSRSGCSTGACHGSFQGKGGLNLSLFGYSPENDHEALVRESLGRRVSFNSPDASLMLLKATGQVPHGGGKRMDKDSWSYQVLREWIAAGAPRVAGAGEVKRMEVTPKELLVAKAGDSGKFNVVVEYADGTKEDVTCFCDFRINDDYVAVAVVGGAAGEVKTIRAGQSPVIITYRGKVQSAHILVQVPQPTDFKYPEVPEVNYVDREVFAKLKKLKIVPSKLSDDGEFLRRVYIDTIGQLPTPDEVRAFVADTSADKRATKIDELLKHPLHAALWATKFSDITGNTIDQYDPRDVLRPKRAKMWHDWFRKRIADNMPYDEIVKGVLCATSRDGKSTQDWVKETTAIEGQASGGWDTDYAKRKSLDLFWQKEKATLEQIGEHTAAAFLGVRIECAQCHKHPADRWTQEDYRAYANIFARVSYGKPSEGKAVVDKKEVERQAQEAVAKIDALYTEKVKTIADKIDKENAEKRQAAVAKHDKEKTDKLTRRNALRDLDRELAAARKAALAAIEKEVAEQKSAAAGNTKGRTGLLKEVLVSNKPARRSRGQTTSFEGLQPKALGGPVIDTNGDPRESLLKWLRTPDNPYFAPSFVNRIWGHYFGMGLVDPVDDFSAGNPASHERLLAELASDFRQHKFDIRHIERTILNSRTYQLSAEPNESNKHDRNSYSRSFPRRMMAEVVVDVLNTGLGVTENFGPEVQPNARAIEVAPNRLAQNAALTNVFRVFGRPPRTSTCDCERPAEPTLPQTLYVMTDPSLQAKITGGRLRVLLASKKTDAEVVEEMFLATLTRLPSDKEKDKALTHVKKKDKREAGFVDVVWALINTPEFILNH